MDRTSHQNNVGVHSNSRMFFTICAGGGFGGGNLYLGDFDPWNTVFETHLVNRSVSRIYAINLERSGASLPWHQMVSWYVSCALLLSTMNS